MKHKYMEDDFMLDGYNYTLPSSAIANHPANPRESAKLLVYERESGRITHSDFYHFCDFIPKETLVVLNNTKVIKARLYAYKLTNLQKSQKLYEIFFHKMLEDSLYLVQIRGRVKNGDRFILGDDICIELKECVDGGMRKVCFIKEGKLLKGEDVLEVLEHYGHMPIPPYIKRPSMESDTYFYQSVFAKNAGSVAAPTASLHFSTQSLEMLGQHFQTCFVTLHIGAGTFIGVEKPDIRDHIIHTESYSLSPQSAQSIEQAKKVLCIGSTSARCVEYYMRHKTLSGECDIFLYPGVALKRVDYLLTNFHLPKSTLLMLVSAMIGREKCLELYKLALKENYRFYSYGDGMLIL